MRYDLLQLPFLARALRSRWPQFIVTTGALGGFVFAIAAGLAGTPVGSRNFGIVFVWIGWWALLMLIAVPFAGRGWCSICPIPAPGEWLQRGAILGPSAGQRGMGLGRRWPTKLRNIWLQNLAFVLVALFSAVVLTQPRVTGIVLAAFLFIALATAIVFERRAFCRYLCPVGGFIGLYSQLAPIELRVRDARVCADHADKTCYTGSADGYGCPWQVFPGGLAKNTYCGTCMECLRTCPRDNIVLNLRPMGADLSRAVGRRMDEAFKAFIMLGSAIVYSAVMLGPWGGLKTAAYAVGTLPWLGYALSFLGLIFLGLPGGFLLAVMAGRALSGTRSRVRQSFIALAYALVPLGLTAWIAFSLSFVFANASYLLPAMSDPLGQGWNLFGGAGFDWRPFASGLVPAAQALVLLFGLAWAGRTALRIAGEGLTTRSAVLLALPVTGYCTLVTLGLLGLLIG